MDATVRGQTAPEKTKKSQKSAVLYLLPNKVSIKRTFEKLCQKLGTQVPAEEWRSVEAAGGVVPKQFVVSARTRQGAATGTPHILKSQCPSIFRI